MILFTVLVVVLFLLAVIYAFLVMPRVIDKGDMDMLLCDYAHRGLWNDVYPENSLAAFERAAREGVGIELDIQLSKDKKIVVFHDYNLLRMCGIEKKISDLNYSELSKLRLKNTEYRIPTLNEVLRLIDGRVPLLIELKGEDKNTELCKRAVAFLDKYDGAFCVESFNPILLSWMKKHRPRFSRGQLVTILNKKNKKGNWLLNFALSNMLLNFLSRPDFIAIDKKMINSLNVKVVSSVFGAQTFVWTVKNKQEYKDIKKANKYTIFEKFKP